MRMTTITPGTSMATITATATVITTAMPTVSVATIMAR